MIENNKGTLKMLCKDQSLIPSAQNQQTMNPAERFLEMFVSIMPKMAEAFQNPSTTQNVTLRVFIDEYIYFIKNNRSASYAESVQLSFYHLTAFFDTQRTLCSIPQKDIESFLIYLQQKVKKGYVVYFRNLKAAFNKAREWKYVSENFFAKVKLPKKQKIMPVFINSDQLSAISNQIRNEVVRNVIVFAFYTGMRLDEIVNLRWKNVDLENRIITVGDEEFTTKGRNQRFIPMSEEAEKAIENLELRMQNERQKIIDISRNKNNEYVFCKENGEKFTGNYFSRRFKKASKAAGMDDAIHFHTLRHSFASNLAQKGVPLYTIKELLGHSSISTTEIYSHLNMDSLREAIEKLDSRPHPDPLLSKERENSSLQIFRINSGEKR